MTMVTIGSGEMANREVTLQLNIDTMVPGRGLVSVNPQDPRQRVMVECLNKSDDGDLVVIEAKVTVIAPRSVAQILVPDNTLLLPQ